MASKRNRGEADSHLQQAIIHRQAAGDIMKCIKQDPEAVRYQDTITKEYPLHAACRCREEQYDTVIMKLLEIFPETAQCKNIYGQYPLHLACTYNRSEIVITKLIELYPTALQGEDMSDWLVYPIYYAIMNDLSLEMIDLFVKTDPLLLQQYNGRVRQTPFQFACCHQKANVVEWFLRLPELKINTRDCHGDTPLHYACGSGNETIIKMLLRHPNIDVNVRGFRYSTALHQVMRNFAGDKRYQIVSMLLEHPDIHVNKGDSTGRTALHIAVNDIDLRPKDCIRIVKLLLLHPYILIDLKDDRSDAPLNIVEKGIRNSSNRCYHNDEEEENEKLILRHFQEAKRLLDDHVIQRKWQSYQYLFRRMKG